MNTWKPNKLVISTSMRSDWEVIKAYNPDGYGLALLRGAREHKVIYETTQIIGRLLKNTA